MSFRSLKCFDFVCVSFFCSVIGQTYSFVGCRLCAHSIAPIFTYMQRSATGIICWALYSATLCMPGHCVCVCVLCLCATLKVNIYGKYQLWAVRLDGSVPAKRSNDNRKISLKSAWCEHNKTRHKRIIFFA